MKCNELHHQVAWEASCLSSLTKQLLKRYLMMQSELKEHRTSKDWLQSELDELLHDFDVSQHEIEELKEENHSLKEQNQLLATEIKKILEERDILANELEIRTEEALSLEPKELELALRNQKEETNRRISLLKAERIGLEHLVQTLYRERDDMGDQLLEYAKKVQRLERSLQKGLTNNPKALEKSGNSSSIADSKQSTAIYGLKKTASAMSFEQRNMQHVKLKKCRSLGGASWINEKNTATPSIPKEDAFRNRRNSFWNENFDVQPCSKFPSIFTKISKIKTRYRSCFKYGSG